MPKSMLTKIILLAVIVFTGLTVIIAGTYIGYVFLQEEVKKQLNSDISELKIKAEQIADFSAIPPGHSVTHALDLFGIKMVMAQYPYNGQNFAIVDPGWALDLSGEEITVKELYVQLKNLVDKVNAQNYFRIDRFEPEKVDTFKAFGQMIDYMTVSISFSGGYEGNFSGIIGIVKNKHTNKKLLITSWNAPDKYRQLTTERFFQNIEFNNNLKGIKNEN